MTLVAEREVAAPGEQHSSAAGPSSGPARSPASSGLVALAIAILAWDPGIARAPIASIDDSWRFMLPRALADGLAFGDDIVFTYGPLSLLDGGPTFSVLGGLATMLVALILSWSFALLLLRRLELMGVGTWPARAAAWLVTIVIIPPLRFSETVALVACAWLLAGIVDRASSRAAIIATAALSGIWFMVKPNVALVMLAAVALAAVASELDRDPLIRRALSRATASLFAALGTTLVVTTSLWALLGQRIGLLDDYLRGSFEIAGGYAAAMSLGPEHPMPVVLLVMIAAGLLARVGWLTLRKPNMANALVLLLVLGVLVWTRQISLSRPAPSHLKDAGVALTCLTVALWPIIGRHTGFAIGLSSTIVTALLLSSAPPYQVGTMTSVGPVEFVSQATRLGRLDAGLDAARAELRRSLAVPEEIVSLMHETPPGSGREPTVHISPHFGIAAFAYELPLWVAPSVQHYVSFTDRIETLNATAIADPSGPDLVLHALDTAIDGHRPAWESPRLNVALFCAFDPVHIARSWALLQRAEAGCGEPAVLADGVPVSEGVLPIPDVARGCEGLLTFRLHDVRSSRLAAAAGLVRRPAAVTVTGDGQEWRFIAATAEQPHAIAAPETERWLGADMPNVDGLPTALRFAPALAGAAISAEFECWTTEASELTR